MKRQLLLLVIGLAGVLVAAGSLARATAGPEPNDIQDSLPGWSSDGTRIALERTAPSLQHVVTMQPSGKDLFVATGTGVFRGFLPGTQSPPYMLVEQDGNTILTIGGRFGGPAAEVHGVDATASPDGTRIAYLRDGTLYVARLDSIKLNTFPTPVPAETAIAHGITPPTTDVLGPVWSPDSSHLAIASGSSLLVLPADGSAAPTVVGQGDNPSWSRDGGTIAYERQVDGAWTIWLVASDGTLARPLLDNSGRNYRFPQFQDRVTALSDSIAYISDRQHVPGGATPYQYALYLRYPGSGATAKVLDDVHPYSPPRWNPTGTAIAVTAGQECRRWGLYVIGLSSHPRRVSNLCRYDGTAKADTIHGSPYFDIINGAGGNDHLYGLGGNDAIYGENGNDVISGGAGNDVIFGGPGNDVISGGAGNDTIIPGNGADRIDCGAGVDTVEGSGPLDRINKNCEHVRR